MDFFTFFQGKINQIIDSMGLDSDVSSDNKSKFVVETPKNQDYGDISTNVAMVLHKKSNKSLVDFANHIKSELEKLPEVQSVSILHGFINIVVKKEFWHQKLKELLILGDNYGKPNSGNNKKINIEFVSANPTGPLHIGHGRGAVIGDVLANIYEFLGYTVTREYYINDAGGQVDTLAKSLYFRYLELQKLEHTFEKLDEFYPGSYLIDIAKNILAKDNDKWVKADISAWLEYFKLHAIEQIMQSIKEDLKIIDIHHDVFSSEKAVATDEKYEEALDKLKSKGLLYVGMLNPPKGKVIEDFEPREQKLFKSTDFGDDSDRPLEKSSGERTYFANDTVYHYDKIKRGYDKLIDVLGADHIGYVKRTKAVVKALSDNKVDIDIFCCQLVNLLDNGVSIKMSKRAGNFVTLKDLVEEVGKDIFRFMMITRKNDVSLDLDVAKAKEQSSDNPVFYIQYAYARIHSVLSKAREVFSFTDDDLKKVDLSVLATNEEINLLKSVLKLSRSMENALLYHDPHRVYLYILEVAEKFHALWNQGHENDDLRFIIKNNQILTYARLSLLYATGIALKSVLGVLGINIKESM